MLRWGSVTEDETVAVKTTVYGGGVGG